MPKRLSKMDSVLREKLMPDFDVAAPAQDSVTRTSNANCTLSVAPDNVGVVRTGIQEVTSTAVVTKDGTAARST
ncbi:hypothetical protein N658DRAFT_497359 [Parathielavia hyrcaniae]|uniref:Uncharacterized protein n=1 Tax=Parathielavia hyrcaniae TaxID=113614 RepID=A0AAN6T0K7_9PEZI|nr:hypothetical protein N658DRAFT_497359 [Parathielavia hyrcaniae]